MESKAIIQKREMLEDSRIIIDIRAKEREKNLLEMVRAIILADLEPTSFKQAIKNIMGVKE